MKLLSYILVLLFISSCVTEKSVRKYIANHPEFVVSKTDTICKTDTVTKNILLDTVFSTKSDTVNITNTIVRNSENKSYKGFIRRKGIEINYELNSSGLRISAMYQQRTIYLTKTVNNGKIITISKPIFNFPWYIILICVSLSSIIIYLIIKKIIS